MVSRDRTNRVELNTPICRPLKPGPCTFTEAVVGNFGSQSCRQSQCRAGQDTMICSTSTEHDKLTTKQAWLGLDSNLHRRSSHNIACVVLVINERVICATLDSDMFREGLAREDCFFFTILYCCEERFAAVVCVRRSINADTCSSTPHTNRQNPRSVPPL